MTDSIHIKVSTADLEAGIPAIDLFVSSGLSASRNSYRQLARQGGAYINDFIRIEEGRRLSLADLKPWPYSEVGGIILRAGKKRAKVVIPI